MEFVLVEGSNNKNFVLIDKLKTKQDFLIYKRIETILYRKEYNRYAPGPNKWASYSYLYSKYLFPVQFLTEVIDKTKSLTTEQIPIINKELYIKNEITREDFDEYIASLKFPEKYKTDIDEYKFQLDSVYLAIRYGMGKIDVSMSGGKTFITYLYIRTLIDLVFDKFTRFIICVPRTSLIKQLQGDFKEYNTYMERPISVESMYAGSKRLIDADVVCGNYASLSNYDEDYFSDFGVFICDEAHTAKTYSIRNEIYSKMRNLEYVFAMTGTMPEWNTLDYLHICSMFGPTIVIKETHEMIESGIASKITVRRITIDYSEPFINGYAQSLLDAGIVGSEKFNAEKKLLQSYEPRTKLIALLLNGLPVNSMILVVNVEYCYQIAEIITPLLNPGWIVRIIHGTHQTYGTVDKDTIINELKTTNERYVVIATYETLGVGISIPNLVNGYLVDNGKSPFRIAQAFGRLMRLLNGLQKDCLLFDFHDNVKGFGVAKHAAERIKIYLKRKLPIKYNNIKI